MKAQHCLLWADHHIPVTQDLDLAAQSTVQATAQHIAADAPAHGLSDPSVQHPPSHMLTHEALRTAVSRDSVQAYRRNDTLDSLEMSDEIYRR